MYSRDHPDEFRVVRPGEDDPRQAEVSADVAWANVLMGEAYNRFMGKQLPSEAILRRLRGELPAPTRIAPGIATLPPKP